jgi:hypothetical protein
MPVNIDPRLAVVRLEAHGRIEGVSVVVEPTEAA